MTRSKLDRRALGLMLSHLANATVDDIFASAADTPDIKNSAYRVGVTGPPGAGKSTLVGRLAKTRGNDIRMGVLAIDPSSPNSGGAILGDRIRMDELADMPDLYIRSFGSRSASDGLTDNLPELIAAMDQFDFDEVMVETVGVGQAEYAIRPHVDTLVLVLLPDSGDIVQAMKAGIMELADILVVNKSDLPGARKMAADIKRIAVFNKSAHADWKPPVLLTASDDKASIKTLSQAITDHGAYLESSGQRDTLVHDRAKYRLRRLLERDINCALQTMNGADLNAPLSEQYRYVLGRLNALR